MRYWPQNTHTENGDDYYLIAVETQPGIRDIELKEGIPVTTSHLDSWEKVRTNLFFFLPSRTVHRSTTVAYLKI